MNEKKLIKLTLQTKGWEYIQAMIEDELVNYKFNTEGKTDQMIAREVTAKEMADKSISKVIFKLNKIKNEPEAPEVKVYK